MAALIDTLIATTMWVYLGAFVTVAFSRTFGKTPPAAATTIYYELKPFILPLALVSSYLIPALNSQQATWADHLNTFCWAFHWWANRNDKDDRWKKRRTRLLETVQQTGARLTVVPASAEA